MFYNAGRSAREAYRGKYGEKEKFKLIGEWLRALLPRRNRKVSHHKTDIKKSLSNIVY